MKKNLMQLTNLRSLSALFVLACLLVSPVSAFDRKGEKNYKEGLKYESAQKWEDAAQQFALAIAANPSDVEFQLHYRRAVFNASQMFMQQGRALSERKDYTGAYNAFRQAYGYDQGNELALSEMERMLRLQREQNDLNGVSNGGTAGNGASSRGGTIDDPASQQPPRSEQLRVITYNGVALESVVRNLAEQLGLNVVFDRDFQRGRGGDTVSINLRDVTTAQALDYIFLSQGLFFNRLNRRTILVADQQKRQQYQPLIVRTFYLANADPQKVRDVLQGVIQTPGAPSIIIPSPQTNSITVRSTPENVRLAGEIIQSIDKDRAAVVMDVAIYEVSRTDLLQLGTQIGNVGTSTTPSSLLGIARTSPLAINLAGAGAGAAAVGVPTALGIGLILPSATISALQRRDNTRLVYKTQMHAFDGEETSTNFGQRIPIQTAVVPNYGFPVQGTNPGTGTGTVNPGVFGGGYPVFNYENTGLQLSFTPQVFPNLDVQVKMKIELTDVLSPGLTPTLTRRAITGTARIQNNRTMMIASVAQDKQSVGREGLPLLGLIPILGRFLTSPRRDNAKTDIVISVTPRVMRAPDVTPRDEQSRPIGTPQIPASESLEAMMQQTEREERMLAVAAAARANKAQNTTASTAQPASTQTTQQTTSSVSTPAVAPASPTTSGNATVNSSTAVAGNTAAAPDAEPSTFVPAPKILMGALAPEPSANGNRAAGGETQTAVMAAPPPAPRPASASNAPSPVTTTSNAELQLVPERGEMRVGERRRAMLLLKTDAPLGMVVARLRFDPRTVAVRGVASGNMFAAGQTQPTVTHSIDKSGVLLVSIALPTGGSPVTGAGVLLVIDVEGLAVGESMFGFDENAVHLITSDGRTVTTKYVPSRLTVKQ